MKGYTFLPLFISMCASLASSVPVQVSGTITDYSGKPVQGAIVKLTKAKISDTTDALGSFHISVASTGVPVTSRNTMPLPFSLQRNRIILNLATAEKVKAELYNVNGRLVQSIYNGTLRAGISSFPLGHLSASNMCILQCRVGSEQYSCRTSFGSIQFGTPATGNTARTAMADKVAGAGSGDTAFDMLEIRHPSYTVQKYLLNPYRDSVVAVSICSINANWITELDSMYIDQEVYAAGLENGNYMAMGQMHSAAGDYNLCFFTLDPTGAVLTKNIYGTQENDLGFQFFLQKDNNVRLFGDLWYTLTDSHFDLMTMVVSPEGDSLGSHIFVTGDEVFGGHGAITNDGGYVIAGHRSFVVNPRGNYYVPRVIRVASDGTVVWTREYEWPHYYSCNSTIIALSDGGFALSGYSYDDTLSDYSIWVLKIDANGNLLHTTILKNKDRPYVLQTYETSDNKLFLLGKNEVGGKEYTYLARFSSGCSLEWDSTILDETKRVWCMTPMENGSFLMAYNKVLQPGTSQLPEEEGIGIIQMKTDGTVIKEVGPIEHFGHPRSIAIGKDKSIIISSASGYTFSQQRFFILNIANVFEE